MDRGSETQLQVAENLNLLAECVKKVNIHDIGSSWQTEPNTNMGFASHASSGQSDVRSATSGLTTCLHDLCKSIVTRIDSIIPSSHDKKNVFM